MRRPPTFPPCLERSKCGGKLFAALLALSGTSAAALGGSGPASSAAGFLRQSGGAAVAAMGGAWAASSQGPESLHLNPAALSLVPRRAATFTHAELVESVSLQEAAYAHHIERWGVLSAGFQYQSAGGLVETDAAGSDLGSVSPGDLALAAGWGRELSDPGPLDGFAVGGAAKLVQSRILKTARTGAVDLGVLSPPLWERRLRLGAALRNVGGELQFDSESSPLPLEGRIGGVFRGAAGWLAAFDLVLPRAGGAEVALGGEYSPATEWAWNPALRAGYGSRGAGDVSGFSGVTFGLGVEGKNLGFDYAILPLGSLGLGHRLSLTARF